MEKPSRLTDYDGKGDPDEHVQVMDNWLSYFSIDDAFKCNLFALNLFEPSRLWFNVLPDGCINYWEEFYKRLSTPFTA